MRKLDFLLPALAGAAVVAIVAGALGQTNVPNPLGPPIPPQGTNFGPAWHMPNGLYTWRSSPFLPMAFGSHVDFSQDAGNNNSPSWISGGGGSATFDVKATDSRFRVTTSGSASTSVVVGFANVLPASWALNTNPPSCFVNPEQATTTNAFALPTVSQVTITWTGSVASAVFDVLCIGASPS